MPQELKRVSRQLPAEEQDVLRQDAALWRAKNCWHPNQLRHTVGTEIRARHGLEAAQVVLGHSNAKITEVYAERDLGLAREVMRQSG